VSADRVFSRGDVDVPEPPALDGSAMEALADAAREVLALDEGLARAANERLVAITARAIADSAIFSLELNQLMASTLLQREMHQLSEATGEAIAAEARAIAVEQLPRIVEAVKRAIGSKEDSHG